MKPKISVVMPVYNGEKYLDKSIRSILDQSYKDFEFLIINDASTDNSEKIARLFDDSRIKIFRNETNLGLVGTLNKGIDLASGEYIARMDQDDISLPERLKIQVDFMETHPEIGLCGSWVKNIGKNKGYINKKESNPDAVKALLLFHTPLAHPTVIFKKNIIDKNNLRYDKNFEYCEDYDLWSRISEFTKISNIEKVLLLYRVHETNMSNVYSEKQREKSDIVRTRQLLKLQINPSHEELKIHGRQKKPKELTIKEFLYQKEAWLNKLITQNDKFKIYKEPYFSQIIAKNWLDTCRANTGEGVYILRRCLSSKLIKKIPTKNYVDILKLTLKSI